MRIDPTEVARLILAGQAPPPAWIPHIVELRLERSYITDLRPVGALTALRRLVLTRSRIGDIAPLAALTRLQHLHLSFTAVSDVAPLAAMTELEGCFLTGSLVEDIAPLAGLTGWNGSILATRGSAMRRHWRDCESCAASISPPRGSRDVTPLAALTALQYLDLTNTPVTDLAPLAALSGLRWLNVRGARADLTVLSHLSRCQIITAATAPRRYRGGTPR